MNFLNIILYVAVIINALLLICLVLIQQSKGGGFGSAFGGVGESVFGARAGNQLTKATVVLTAIFFVLTLLLVVVQGHNDDSGAIKFNSGSGVEAAAAVPAKTENATVPEKK